MSRHEVSGELLRCLVFRSPKQVDWKATYQRIAALVLRKDPKGRPAERAIWTANLGQDLRNFVHYASTARAYELWQDQGGKNE